MQPFIILFIWLFSFSLMRTSNSVDTLALGQCIRDGETLISAGGTFEVGFFSPGTSTTNRYFGVWYRNVTPSTVVWVANRDTPLQHNSSGVIKLNENGVLQILNVTNSTLWSSNMSNKTVNDPIAQILESGNLVVKHAKDSNKDQFLWQSFDLPCDTLIIGGMKLGWDLVSGQEIFLSSWKSADDPAKGVYSANIDPRGYPQFVILEKSVMKYRIGSWNGLGFTGFPTHQLPQHYSFEFVLNEKHIYFECKIFDRSITSIYTLTPSGLGQISVWTSRTSSRKVISNGNEDECENYALCGSYSICNMDGNVVNCECLKGYVPKFPEQWNISYWSNGCVPRTKLDCNNSITDGFWRYKDIKLPDTSSSWFNKTMNLEECHKSCLKNCSCTAYASLDIRNGGSGCLLWFDNLIDMKQFSQWGQDLYIRVPASELVTGHRNMKKKLARIITCGLIIFGLTTCVSMMILRKKTARIYNHVASFQWQQEYFRLGMEDMDLPTFDMSVLANATNNFSSRNKLGEGGFGAVYQGTLMDGQEVAIKRHSNNSDQGLEEFKNEVMVIAKLQHLNLVKLIGCCIEGEEKMLIYEYMPNKSLDYFIFDESRSKILDWCQRFHIIDGITRGLLYLHQDSRLRIIHRDLKTSNILLDAHMNPKISDFGLARIFGGDQSEAKTKKVVGTYGYMPPEYAVHGHYSMKSDVFSFGVIVLEMVSGKKNRGFSESENYYNLLGYAWRFWTEDRPLELIDENLGDRWISSEVIRCIHVGLLCVQQKPDDRPDMSSVVLMLNGEKLLPQPKGPGFCTGRCLPEAESSSRICNLLSPNEMSFTMFEAR